MRMHLLDGQFVEDTTGMYDCYDKEVLSMIKEHLAACGVELTQEQKDCWDKATQEAAAFPFAYQQ